METKLRLFKEDSARYEVWDPFDKRLPESVDRPLGKDFAAFCESFAAGQIHPIVVGKIGKKFYLAVGRQRLLAARHLQIPIEVKIVDVKGEEDIIRLRVSENQFRSANEAADVLAIIQAVFFQDKTYDQCIPGMTKNEALRLHKKWEKVPYEFLEAAAEGRCSIGTALEAGKLKGSARNKAVERLDEANAEGERMSLSDIKEIRSAVRAKAVGKSMTWLTDTTPARQTYNRMEIERLASLYETDFAQALLYKQELLG